MYQIVDLTNIKQYMAIDTTNHDTLLTLFQNNITKFIEKYISNFGITRHINAEYQNGDGTRNLMLQKYPVYKLVSLYDDADRGFASSTLISSDDYWLDYKIGKIQLTNDESIFYSGQGNVKVDYWAGLSRFLVVDEQNNYLDITDTGGTAAVEIPEKTTLDYSGYNAEDLATAIQTALNADATLNGTYTVTYNHNTQKFKISCDEAFSILWNSGDNAAKNIGTLLNFTVSSDDTGATSYTADKEATGMPDDIIMVACMIADQLYDLSKKGKGTSNVKSMRTQNNMDYEFIIDAVPPVAKTILDQYKRIYL